MLDTDISSYIIKANNPALAQKLDSCKSDSISISSITYAELMAGAKKKNSPALFARIKMFLSLVNVMDFDKAAGDEYAVIRTALTENGTLIGNMDMLIAAHAKSCGAILVTNNEKHFSKIPDFRFENWIGHHVWLGNTRLEFA
ncbi:MAG: type II toxin-antitoxin system VapC family toxin [Treponemataceae bacterium]|nr:MAG: type II toxin-antitoxin system VapC family toxin [Treponemataceae bacterium]